MALADPWDEFQDAPTSGPALRRVTPPPAPAPQTPAQSEYDTARARREAAEAAQAAAEAQRGTGTEGQNALDTEYAKRFADWRLGGFSDARRNADQLREQIGVLRTTNVTGRVLGRLPDILVDDKVVNTRQQVEEVIQRNLRAVLGAQFTAQEGQQLISRAFNPRLDEAVNARRLARLLQQMEAAGRANDEAAAYFEEHGTLRGWNGRLWSFGDFNPEQEDEPGRQEEDQAGAAMPAAGLDPETGLINVNVTGGRQPTPEEARNDPEIQADFERVRRAFPDIPFEEYLHIRERGEDPIRFYMENQLNRTNPITAGVEAIWGAESANAFNRGLGDTVTLGLSDEIGAGIDAALGGDFNTSLARERRINAYDTEHNFWARTGGQLVGGAAMPYSRAAGLGRMMAEGAGYGMAYGVGSGEGIEDRLRRGAVGAGVGAAIPVTIRGITGAYGLASNRLPRMNITDEGRQIAQAARAERVPISRPIVDPTSRARMAYLESSLGSGGPIRQGLEGTEDAIERRVGDLTNGGTVEELGTMGGRIQEAGQRYRTESRNAAQRVYDRAADAAEGATVRPWMAIRRLDEHISELSGNRNTNRTLLDYLQSVRRDLVDENGDMIPKTVAQLRDFRTGLRGEISARNLMPTRAEAIMTDVLDVAGQDLARDLRRSAPQAAGLYAQADNMWRERAAEMRQVIERVIGPRDNPMSGEQVMAQITRMAGPKGNSRGLQRLWERLTPEERIDAAATIADTAGRASPDAPFETGRFTRWAASLSPAARRTIFGDEGAQSIANLAVLSRALTDTRKALNNSRSGQVANYRAFFRDFLSGSGTGTVAAMVTGNAPLPVAAAGAGVGAALSTGGMALRNLSARALMSPDMSMWLREAGEIATQAGVRNHIAKLTGIAARNPAIAQEATGLQAALSRAANDNVGQVSRAAASGDDEENR